MAASVADLLMAARAKRSPFMSLMEGAAQGFSSGLAQAPAREKMDLEIQAQRMKIEEAKAAQAYQANLRAERDKQLAADAAAQAKAGFDIATVKGKPTHPAAKLEKYVEDESGKITKTTTDAPRPNSLEDILTQKVQSGEMTLKEAMAAKASGQGVTPGLSYQMQKDAEKKEIDLKELQVPGYQLGSEVRPTQVEAQKLRDAMSSMTGFDSNMGRMIELVKKHGSTELMGKASGEMKSLASDMKLQLKDVAKLGVLSASDLALMEAQIIDPSAFGSMGTSTPTALTQLETTRANARKKFDSSMASRGYSAAGGQETPKAPAAPKTKAPGGKIKMSDGKETLYVDASDEADAAKEGFARVP